MLRARGFTLGHYPQSFEYATVGGWVATRSAGQASTGYGRIDELVEGVRLATPSGDLDLPAHPASAAGPDLRELVVGSEGVLGVITEVTLRVRPRPPAGRYEAWMLPSFAAGHEALRACVQERGRPGRRAALRRAGDDDVARARGARGHPRGAARPLPGRARDRRAAR